MGISTFEATWGHSSHLLLLWTSLVLVLLTLGFTTHLRFKYKCTLHEDT